VPNIVVYSSPFCGYCGAAKRLLTQKGYSFEEIDVVFDPARRSEMLQLSGRRTIPQIFIDGAHIGGYDDLKALDQRGELDRLMAAAQAQSAEQ
jgi:glutaredoxin 3